MAWGYFMNMEKLSLLIAEKHITLMTEDNYYDSIFLDDKKLLNNIENGFVAITQLNTYFESFLNTIIDYCIGYNGDALLKCSIQEKIDIIFMHYQKDWDSIKSKTEWETHKKVTRVRNDMVHFKKTFIGDSTGTPNFKLGGEDVAKFFTKSNINKMYNKYVAWVIL